MKEIPNQRFDKDDTVASLLIVCLNNPTSKGLDLATIRARNRVADVVEKVQEGEVIKLEDADYSAAREAIKEVRWLKRDRHLITFAELFGL